MDADWRACGNNILLQIDDVIARSCYSLKNLLAPAGHNVLVATVMMKRFWLAIDDMLIRSVDELVRSIQYRYKVRYGVIIAFSLLMMISMTSFGVFRSFSVLEGLLSFWGLYLMFVALWAVGVAIFWTVYKPTLYDMTVPVYDHFARLALATRENRRFRIIYIMISLVIMAIQLPDLGGSSSVFSRLSLPIVCSVPLLLFVYVLCSLPVISQDKVIEFLKERE